MNKGNVCAGEGQHGEGWDRVCRRVVLMCTCLIVLRSAPGKADRGCSIAQGRTQALLVIRAEFKSQRMLSAMWASHTIDAKPDKALGRTGVGWGHCGEVQ